MTPGVSVVIPTLNNEKYLDECLGALRDQDWPRDRIEILLVDAGSSDRTVEIARRYDVDRVLDNPLRTGEAGKAVGARAARHELICLVDADNVVVGRDWLQRMTAPFEDPEVISSEPLRWEYRREDHFINRYQALTGINDPLALFIGNYDRFSALTGRWTDYPYESEPRDGWEKVRLDPRWVPTMGANGYIVRRSALDVVHLGDYLIDIDFAYDLAQAGQRTIARVDIAIRHYFCDSVGQFYRKTRRRIDDYFYFVDAGLRSYPWLSRGRVGVARFVASSVLVLPLLWQVGRGMARRPDPAWFFHLPACWITLGVYAEGSIRGLVRPKMYDRAGWNR